MSKKEKKFYVVWEGLKPGIYTTWDECKDNIHNFKGAKYKSFKTLELAKKAFSENYDDYKGKTFFECELSEEELKLIGSPIKNSLTVDAACKGVPGPMEYQGVDFSTGKKVFHKGPFLDSTNNIGEYLALVHALAYMKKKGDNRPIYSDSKIAISWVKDKGHRTNHEPSELNKDSFNLLKRADKWLKENEYPNKILKWETKAWGEIPADFGRK